MRIWSLHPKYLDRKGLGGVWCETLLAKAVLEGKTKGYKHHPQLNRFRESSDPVQYISSYLSVVHAEAVNRGLNYDPSKIGQHGDLKPLTVTKGQLDYEWNWLLSKLKSRSPEWYGKIQKPDLPDTHPIFTVVEGGIESWEVVQPTKKPPPKKSKPKVDKQPELSEETPVPVNSKKKRSNASNHGESEIKTEPVNAKKKRSSSSKHGDPEHKTAKQVSATNSDVAETVNRKSLRDRGGSKRVQASSEPVKNVETVVKKPRKRM